MAGQKGLLLVVLLLSLLLTPVVRAQDDEDFAQDQLSEVVSHARIVRLSHIEGTVQLDSDRGFENATVNTPLAEGDRLLARSDSWAEVQFEDGSTLRLSPDTQITFAQLGLNADGGTVTAIDLDQGEAEFTIQKHEGSDFAVTARNKTIFLKHSGRFRVTTTNSTPLEIVVWKGEVTVSDSATGSHVAVKTNEDFTLDPFDFDKYDLEKGAMADELDNWSQQRDEYLSTYAATGSGSYTQSPYQYGLSDLNYYGTYYNVPDYGYLWQPAGIGPGWDPFMNGYWTWSPVYGYCWVSAYPWGWMPYRYGRWIWVSGYGWMWQPGDWHGWRPRPRLWNTPPGFHPPAPPTRMVFGRPASPPVGVKPGTVQPGGIRPGTGQPRPGTAGTPGRVGPQPGSQPVPAGGGMQVPRIDVQRDQRGHRVFTNEEIQDRVPRKDTAAAPGGTVRMERRDEAAQPAQPPMRTVEVPAMPSGPAVQPAPAPSGRQPKEARPSEVRPGEVPRRVGEGPVVSQPQPAPASVPKQPAPVVSRPEAPRTEAPVMHEHPAPAQVPRQQPAPQPAPAPRSVSPPPAPHTQPAPAPRASSPPPAAASHGGAEHGSRPSESRSPDRPK